MSNVFFPFMKNANKHFELEEEGEEMDFDQKRTSTRRKSILRGFDKQFQRVIKKIHNKEVDPLS